MRSYIGFILFLVCIGYAAGSYAQDDKKKLSEGSLFHSKKDSFGIPKKTTVIVNDTPHTNSFVKKDSIPIHNPRIATRRSAILPGWGQAYNKEYWKIPIVYGILAIPTVL